jgi:hypothetical protein
LVCMSRLRVMKKWFLKRINMSLKMVVKLNRCAYPPASGGHSDLCQQGFEPWLVAPSLQVK